MNALFLGILLSTTDALSLDSDSWAIRQAAEARLAAWGAPVAFPALLAVRRISPETRHRADRVLRSWQGFYPVEYIHDAAWAYHLFYGPDEPDQFSGDGPWRWLSEATTSRLEQISRDRLVRMAGWARLCGLLKRGEVASVEAMKDDGPAYERWCWINTVRWRAVGDTRY